MNEASTWIVVIIISFGSLGIIFSITAMYVVYRQKILHNAFGCICVVHSFVECGIFLTMPVVGTTSALLYPESTREIYFAYVGAVTNYFHYAATNFQCLKSLNRCYAIIFPMSYRNVFTTKTAIILIAITLGLTGLQLTPFIEYECNMTYDFETFGFVYRSSSCFTSPWRVFNKYVKYAVMGIALSGDAITWLFLRKFNNQMMAQNHAIASKEKRFFFLACLTTLIYGLMQIIPLLVQAFLPASVWTRFFGMVGNWLIFHSMNELLFILLIFKFNKSFTVASKSSKPSTHNTINKSTF